MARIYNPSEKRSELLKDCVTIGPGKSVDPEKLYGSLEAAAKDAELVGKVAAGLLKSDGVPGLDLAKPSSLTSVLDLLAPKKAPNKLKISDSPPPPPATEPDSQPETKLAEAGELSAGEQSDWTLWSLEMLYKLAQVLQLSGRSKYQADREGLVAFMHLNESKITEESVAAVLGE